MDAIFIPIQITLLAALWLLSLYAAYDAGRDSGIRQERHRNRHINRKAKQ